MAEKIVIVSTIPGRHRGGMTHPQAAEYPLGAISREQLLDIVRDPVLTVAVGELVTTASLDDVLDRNDTAGGRRKAPARGAEKA
ncbi:MAG: hypothetical protein ACRDNS_27505 [Trebonia sp.]